MKIQVTLPIPDELARVPQERWEQEVAAALGPVLERIEKEWEEREMRGTPSGSVTGPLPST